MIVTKEMFEVPIPKQKKLSSRKKRNMDELKLNLKIKNTYPIITQSSASTNINDRTSKLMNELMLGQKSQINITITPSSKGTTPRSMHRQLDSQQKSHRQPSAKLRVINDVLKLIDFKKDYANYKSPAKMANTSRTLSAKRPISNTSKANALTQKSEEAYMTVAGQNLQNNNIKLSGKSSIVLPLPSLHLFQKLQPIEELTKNYNLNASKRSNSVNVIQAKPRRVHEDGALMLDKKFFEKDAKLKLESMANRVKRLQFEEDRANKMADFAQQRADKMIEARKRHYGDLISQKNFHTQIKNQERQKREQINQMRIDHSVMLYRKRIETLSKNVQNKYDGKAAISSIMEENNEFNQKIEETAKMKYLQIQIGRTQSQRNKIIRQEQGRQMSRQQYAGRMQETEIFIKEASEQINRYEGMERQLIDKLKETTHRQRSAYMNLEKIVTDGYQYYQQAFTEKKAMADERRLPLIKKPNLALQYRSQSIQENIPNGPTSGNSVAEEYGAGSNRERKNQSVSVPSHEALQTEESVKSHEQSLNNLTVPETLTKQREAALSVHDEYRMGNKKNAGHINIRRQKK